MAPEALNMGCFLPETWVYMELYGTHGWMIDGQTGGS